MPDCMRARRKIELLFGRRGHRFFLRARNASTKMCARHFPLWPVGARGAVIFFTAMLSKRVVGVFVIFEFLIQPSGSDSNIHKNKTAPTDSKRSNRDQKRRKMTLTKLTCDILLLEQKWIVQFLFADCRDPPKYITTRRNNFRLHAVQPTSPRPDILELLLWQFRSASSIHKKYERPADLCCSNRGRKHTSKTHRFIIRGNKLCNQQNRPSLTSVRPRSSFSAFARPKSTLAQPCCTYDATSISDGGAPAPGYPGSLLRQSSVATYD